LREQGLDYEEIAAALGVSKSSVSLWVRDMPRPDRLSYEECVVFVNSDPALIRFFLRFLDTVGIGRKDLTYRVHIHETADVLGAERFWQRVTQADPRQFRRTVLKTHNPRTVRANVGDDYHGCLRVEVRRSGELYRQIDGWTSSIMADPTGPDAPEST
jgi:transcriptional regulator with XRE-family HTH domain